MLQVKREQALKEIEERVRIHVLITVILSVVNQATSSMVVGSSLYMVLCINRSTDAA